MTDRKTAIEVRHVSKRFVIRQEKSIKERLLNFGRSEKHKQDFWALKDVTLDIQEGTTVGLIGPNGSGKSTLLKTIGGIIQPTEGSVRSRGRLAALLELGAGFHPDLTGRENVFLNAAILGISREETETHFDEIVEFSGIGPFIDTQVKFYSSGMYVRLAFAVAVHVDPDILLVDEVLAVGDEAFQEKCLATIRDFQREGKTIVLVSHSLDQVAEFCTRAIVLEHGEVAVDGTPKDAIRRLRADFEKERVTEVAKGHLPARLASLGAVRLLDPRTDEPCDRIPTGGALRLEIEIDAAQDTTECYLGMGIETMAGASVYGTNTELLQMPLDLKAGRSRVRFDLPSLPLGSGRYTVHASLAVQGLGEQQRLGQAAAFVVTGREDYIGVVEMPVSASILVSG